MGLLWSWIRAVLGASDDAVERADERKRAGVVATRHLPPLFVL